MAQKAKHEFQATFFIEVFCIAAWIIWIGSKGALIFQRTPHFQGCKTGLLVSVWIMTACLPGRDPGRQVTGACLLASQASLPEASIIPRRPISGAWGQDGGLVTVLPGSLQSKQTQNPMAWDCCLAGKPAWAQKAEPNTPRGSLQLHRIEGPSELSFCSWISSLFVGLVVSAHASCIDPFLFFNCVTVFHLYLYVYMFFYNSTNFLYYFAF
jgi:hypothetical protein